MILYVHRDIFFFQYFDFTILDIFGKSKGAERYGESMISNVSVCCVDLRMRTFDFLWKRFSFCLQIWCIVFRIMQGCTFFSFFPFLFIQNVKDEILLNFVLLYLRSLDFLF